MDFKDRPLGVVPSRKDFRDYHISEVIPVLPAASFPDEFTVPFLPAKPYDQNGWSMCVSFALKAILGMQKAKEFGAWRQEFSAPWIYGMRFDGQYRGEGMEPRDALTNLVKYGGAPDQPEQKGGSCNECVQWVTKNMAKLSDLALPNKLNTFAGMTKVDEIKSALTTIGPVLYCIPVYDSFYLGGDLNLPDYERESINGYHALTIVGWTKKGRWKILNSWGNWGLQRGYCTVPFDYPYSEIWSVTDLPRQSVIEMTVGSKTYKVNGVEKQSDVAPFLQGDRTFVPVRFVAEAMGAEVQWGANLGKIYIMK